MIGIKEAAFDNNIGIVTLAKQLRSGYSNCLFEYVNNPKLKKKIKCFINIITKEIILDINKLSIIENMSISAIKARTDRESKTWNYRYHYIDYREQLKLNKLNNV